MGLYYAVRRSNPIVEIKAKRRARDLELTVAPGSVVTPTLGAFVAYAQYLAMNRRGVWAIGRCSRCKRFILVERRRRRPPSTCGTKECARLWRKQNRLGVDLMDERRTHGGNQR